MWTWRNGGWALTEEEVSVTDAGGAARPEVCGSLQGDMGLRGVQGHMRVYRAHAAVYTCIQWQLRIYAHILMFVVYLGVH